MHQNRQYISLILSRLLFTRINYKEISLVMTVVERRRGLLQKRNICPVRSAVWPSQRYSCLVLPESLSGSVNHCPAVYGFVCGSID